MRAQLWQSRSAPQYFPAAQLVLEQLHPIVAGLSRSVCRTAGQLRASSPEAEQQSWCSESQLPSARYTAAMREQLRHAWPVSQYVPERQLSAEQPVWQV